MSRKKSSLSETGLTTKNLIRKKLPCWLLVKTEESQPRNHRFELNLNIKQTNVN